MNFIIIVSDTLRRDHLGCYGNTWISTPHIDRFAEQSQVFDRAYSASFPTVPHRRDVMTGRFTASYTGWASLSKEEVVLSQTLGQAGYLSMMVCDCPHILENGYHYDRGFDGFEWIRGQESDRWKTYPEAPEHPCDPAKIRGAAGLQRHHRRNAAWWRKEADRFVARTMGTACDWLEDNYQRERFFLYIDTFDPHEPWDAPQWYIDRYDPGYTGEVVDYPLYSYTDFLSEAELKHCRALYAAEVTLVDRWVGRVFEKIEDLGLLKNTLVIFTTDHGFLHGEHSIIGKGLISPQGFSYIPLYEEINHIPFIVYMPGVSPARRQALIQPMDIMPTLLGIADVDIPDTVHGTSFASVLSSGNDHHREFALSSGYVNTSAALATVVQDHWTAILSPLADQQKGTQEGLIDKAVDGYDKRQTVRAHADLLFDLSTDPDQEHSVADDHPDLLAEFRDQFVGFLAEVGTSEEAQTLWRGES